MPLNNNTYVPRLDGLKDSMQSLLNQPDLAGTTVSSLQNLWARWAGLEIREENIGSLIVPRYYNSLFNMPLSSPGSEVLVGSEEGKFECILRAPSHNEGGFFWKTKVGRNMRSLFKFSTKVFDGESRDLTLPQIETQIILSNKDSDMLTWYTLPPEEFRLGLRVFLEPIDLYNKGLRGSYLRNAVIDSVASKLVGSQALVRNYR